MTRSNLPNKEKTFSCCFFTLSWEPEDGNVVFHLPLVTLLIHLPFGTKSESIEVNSCFVRLVSSMKLSIWLRLHICGECLDLMRQLERSALSELLRVAFWKMIFHTYFFWSDHPMKVELLNKTLINSLSEKLWISHRFTLTVTDCGHKDFNVWTRLGIHSELFADIVGLQKLYGFRLTSKDGSSATQST